MARVFTEGFEMGDLLDIFCSGGGTIKSSSDARSGAYSCSISAATICIPEADEYYFRVGYYCRDVYAPGANNRDIIILKNGTNNIFSVNMTYDYTFSIKINNVSREALYLANDVYRKYILIEGHGKIDGVNGEFTVKINGIRVLSFLGNTLGSYATMDGIAFAAGAIGWSSYYDDIAINDTTGVADNSWCGDGHIVAIKPNAAGDVTQLTNSAGNSVDNHTYVDDIPSDGDATYVWSDTAEEYDLYGLTNPSLPAYSRITRVFTDIRAKDPVNGGIAPMLKVGGTEYEGDETIVSYVYQRVRGNDYPLNPATGEKWEEAEINDLQAGVKIK